MFGTHIRIFIIHPVPLFKQEAPLAKLLKARGSRHPGQAMHDPESSIFEQLWIPAPAPDPDPGFAGMTE
jgi:hypothetical protein